MLKILLIVAATLLLLACGKTVLAKKGDKYIWLKAHSSYPNIQPYWKENELEHKTYFGKYTHFNDIFNDYYGDPLGPIVAIWSVTRYSGDKPAFKDCGKEPKIPKSAFGTPEYEQEKGKRNILRKEFKVCKRYNRDLKQKSKTTTYYYARSTNNYLPKLPKRFQNHALYDIHISFGPMGGIVERGLTEKEKANKDQLYNEPCHRYGKDDTCYRLTGEDSHFYYTVRSVLKKEQTADGKASSSWKQTKFIREEPHHWEEIQGIEITKSQYEYLQKRCVGVFDCYLDNKAPDLSTEQKAYIKATTWDIDSDEEALKALIKKAKTYRANEQ